ncbi:MAG: SEL1-like repeat protein [Reyranella sp.]|nr:SEL1-like repeat protein [Reyranella sp.]
MTGKPNWPRSLAAAPSLAKRPVVLAGVAILLIGATSAGVWLTRPADTAEKRATGEPSSSPPLASVASIVVPEAPAPPELTSIDVARSGDPLTAMPALAPPASAEPPKPIDWAAMPIDELRLRATANEIPAMEELARRLVQGAGVTKDQQAGAGWLLRAAQSGSAQSAFNVAVMYERGFVVERDSTRAIEWYRKAIAANLPAAKHNLALLLRDGKGAPRDGKEAVELLRSAAHQGMAASMFTLGDIHERGDAAPKDAATALAWFAITAEFERQTHRGTETALAKTASQRSQTLQRILTPAELERAQQLGQSEFKLIVEALSPPKPAPPIDPAPPEAVVAVPDPALPLADVDPPGWPKAANDQVRVIQQALFDLKFLRDKPDGAMGPMTRAAIRSFQRSNAMREIGEPTRDVYAALKDALASRDVIANSPLPLPPPEKVEVPTVELPKAELPKAELPKAEAPKADVPKAEPADAEAAKAEAAKVEVAKVEAAKIEAAKAEAAMVEAAKVEAAKVEAAKVEAAKVAAAKTTPAPATIDIGRPELPPPPPTSAEIARTMPKEMMPKEMLSGATRIEPAKAVPDSWPTAPVEQVRAIQQLLRDLNFSSDTPDGLNGPNTRAAIRDYERAAALSVTGEPSKALFDSLMELRLLMVPKAN